MRPVIRTVEPIVVSLPRDTPYLGPLAPGEAINSRGYLVRKGNRTLYPARDMSVLVKIVAADGTVGWGETYGIVAPQATAAIVREALGPVIEGRTVEDPGAIWQELYDLMRVRGGSGGYYGDALAGVDIALWDLLGKSSDRSVADLLGGRRHARLPAYVSGLPRATLAGRVDLARSWIAQGFRAIKYAAAVSHEGVVAEMRALREALGPGVDLMVDLHWRYGPDEALALARELAPFAPRFIEAPCAPEDLDGLARVAAEAPMPVAAGEEWHNVYEARWRLERGGLAVVQPEVAHTGLSQFVAIAGHALDAGAEVMPHATIGIGVFMAASLLAASTLSRCPYHEYQPSVFDANLRHVDTAMACAAGFYTLPAGPGLGAAPRESLWEYRIDA